MAKPVATNAPITRTKPGNVSRWHLHMLGLHRRPSPSPSDDDGGYLTCYSIVIACAALLLLSILAATISFGKACAFAGAVGVFFGFVGCISRRCNAHASGGTGAGVLPTTVAAAAARPAVCSSCGLVDAAIDALPAFAYARPAAESGSSKSGRSALCPVCLEDVQAGEMVRQLPACRHLFHVECIDMWLHSHRTCPLCRCDVVSPQPATVKATAAAGAGAVQSLADDALPPV